MTILVSYDINSRHQEFKQAMKNKGYMDSWQSGDKKRSCNLPNTTLWHNQKNSVSDGVADMKAVATALGVRLQRAVCVPTEPWDGITGDPHT